MYKFVLLLAGLLTFATPAFSEQSIAIPFSVGGLTARLGFKTAFTGRPFEQRTGRPNSIVWVNDLYEMRVTSTVQRGATVLRLQVTSTAGKPLPVSGVFLQVLTPSAVIDGVWTPSGRIAEDRLISAEPGKEFIAYSAANYGIPYLAAASSTGANVLAIGLLRQDLSVQLRAAPSQGRFYEFQLNADVPPNRSTVDHRFFVSNDASYRWFDIAEQYADWVDTGTNYSQFPISPRCYMPVYDTWYWSQDNVDEHLYLQTGRMAAEAGLDIFLADSGWDAPTGEYNKWLLGSTGNYMPPPEKFPNLAGTFDLLRSAFNLKIQLWLQPFAVGRTSVRYAATQALHIQIPKTSNSGALAPAALPNGPNTLEDVNFCPQSAATHEYLKALFDEMASTYRPEGYWLDYIDGMPPMCIAQHRHDFDTFGAGFRAALATIRQTILKYDPNPIVHFRAQYANLNNKSFSNVWQPFDSPNNFDRMRLDDIIQFRLQIGFWRCFALRVNRPVQPDQPISTLVAVGAGTNSNNDVIRLPRRDRKVEVALLSRSDVL